MHRSYLFYVTGPTLSDSHSFVERDRCDIGSCCGGHIYSGHDDAATMNNGLAFHVNPLNDLMCPVNMRKTQLKFAGNTIDLYKLIQL